MKSIASFRGDISSTKKKDEAWSRQGFRVSLEFQRSFAYGTEPKKTWIFATKSELSYTFCMKTAKPLKATFYKEGKADLGGS
jgi:hypothetical protein